jgi:hypothetical protein
LSNQFCLTTYFTLLTNLCADCKQIQFANQDAALAKYPFQEKGLAQLSYDYNNWMFDTHPIATEKRMKLNRQKTRAGIFAGYNAALISTPLYDLEQEKTVSRGGFSLGALLQWGLFGGVSMQTGCQYVQGSSEDHVTGILNEYSWTNRRSVSALSIPLLFQAVIGPGNRLRPLVQAGYQISFTLDQQNLYYRYPGYALGGLTPEYRTYGGTFQGLVVGVGLEYQTGPRTPFVLLRYTAESIPVERMQLVNEYRGLHFIVGVKW